MALFGSKTAKRHRASRLSGIGSSHRTLSRVWTALKDRGVLARLLLVLFAMLVLTMVVEGWKSPFRFRRGDRPAHGVLATVQFDRVDRHETERRRRQAEERVPRYFRRQPMQIDSLKSLLRSDFHEIAKAMSAETVTADVRKAFGLQVDATEADTPARRAAVESQWQSLKNVVTAADEGREQFDDKTRQERLESLLDQFGALAAIIERRGCIDESDITKNNLQPGTRLLLMAEDLSDEADIVSVVDVDLKTMLDAGGPIAAQWDSLMQLNPIRPQMEQWIRNRVRPTLRYDYQATDEARQVARKSIEEVYETRYPEQVLIRPGQRIKDEELELLLDEYRAAESRVPSYVRLIRVSTSFLMIALLAFINGYYLVHNEPKLVRSISRLMTYLATIIIAVAISRWLTGSTLRPELVPVTVAAMILAVAYNQVMAALTAITISLLLTLSTVGDLSQFVILLSCSVTAVIPLSQVSSRLTLIKVGFLTAIACMLVFCGMEILGGHSLEYLWSEQDILVEGLKGAGWCLVAGYLVAGSLPFIENVFGVVTDISLLELSDISHPLLQELVRRAPGTYNHSIAVATIAESAAEAVGGNGLLVRVGAYYHDIGKMLKPEYFVENMTEGMKSKHDNLVPAMSTLIIIGHVKDGVDLARQHHIPQSLIDFIEQHHGTTLVKYFFLEATKLAEEDPDHSCDVLESSYRYPGPKPQTREAGVLMLADAVESASRTLNDPTPKRIESLVHKITLDRLLDGQFEESNLTLSEIRTIEESLTKSLIAIYHGRIKYPDQR